jgi:hypothetical protein
MSKRFKDRAALTSAPYVNELVSSQLLFQLPQNSGARRKGNWPLETGQLQSLADCPISWHCDIPSKRASKSKSSVHKEMAKASGSEVHSSHGKGYMKAQEGEMCWLQTPLSRHRTQLPLLSPQASASPYLQKPASRGTSSPTLKPEELARNISLGWRLF